MDQGTLMLKSLIIKWNINPKTKNLRFYIYKIWQETCKMKIDLYQNINDITTTKLNIINWK